MSTGRRFIAGLWSVAIVLSVSAIPCKIKFSGSTVEFSFQSALAKNGGNGNGKGGGGSGGGGGGGGNGKGGGSANSNKSDDNSGGASRKGAAVGDDTSPLDVRHNDGMSEQIRNGRYIMKDARGRTIVNRRATSADAKRLQSFIH
jgi:hypothetical protein